MRRGGDEAKDLPRYQNSKTSINLNDFPLQILPSPPGLPPRCRGEREFLQSVSPSAPAHHGRQVGATGSAGPPRHGGREAGRHAGSLEAALTISGLRLGHLQTVKKSFTVGRDLTSSAQSQLSYDDNIYLSSLWTNLSI